MLSGLKQSPPILCLNEARPQLMQTKSWDTDNTKFNLLLVFLSGLVHIIQKEWFMMIIIPQSLSRHILIAKTIDCKKQEVDVASRSDKRRQWGSLCPCFDPFTVCAQFRHNILVQHSVLLKDMFWRRLFIARTSYFQVCFFEKTNKINSLLIILQS